MSTEKKKEEKKLKIVVAINSLVATQHPAYSNHWQFAFRLGRNYPHDFTLVNPSRMSIDRFRNMAAEVCLDLEFDYVLFLDDDVLVPHDCLTKLLEADADIASADVIIRGYPFDHMLFRYKNKKKDGLIPLRKLPEPRGVIDVDAVGCSLTLIKASLFKKMARPYFVTGPTTNTEDIYFCLKAAKAYPKITIKADTRIICHHILWAETIGSDNKKAYKKYHEAMYGIPEQDKKDRGAAYLKMVKGITGEANAA